MIVFDKVSLKYPYDEYAVIKDASFALTAGVNTVLCDVQSGKSSLCRLLIKEVSPTSGKILSDGEDISRITNERLGILYLPNNPVFFERRSVLYNIAYPLKLRKVAKSERLSRAREIADSLHIPDVNVRAGQLDERTRKAAALARGLTVKRNAVLFDDFFGEAEYVDEVLDLFVAEIKAVFTSDVSLARGNVTVMDGGYTVFCGGADGAKRAVDGLGWIYDSLRRENG